MIYLPFRPFPVVCTTSSYNIFNEAMAAVLKMMDTNFSAEFKESEAFKNLEKVVEQEAEELERLRKVGVRLEVARSRFFDNVR